MLPQTKTLSYPGYFFSCLYVEVLPWGFQKCKQIKKLENPKQAGTIDGATIVCSILEARKLAWNFIYHEEISTTWDDINHPDTCWKGKMVGYEQARRIIEITRNNILTQMLDKTTTGGTQPDLQLIKEELVMDVMVIDSLDCKDDVVDFKLLRERRKANSIL